MQKHLGKVGALTLFPTVRSPSGSISKLFPAVNLKSVSEHTFK